MMSRVRWCFNCNVPILGENCGICGNEGHDCAKDLKPIFDKERELLEKHLATNIPPFSFRYRNRIIVGGKTYLTFRIDAQRKRLVLLRGPQDKKLDYAPDKNLIGKAIKANLDVLKKKETTAIEFIRKVHEESSRSITLFGGGKDSAVTAILAKKAVGNVPLLFIDTTLEFPETYKFVEKFSRIHGFDLLKNEDEEFYGAKHDFFQLCKRLGPPSIYCRWCCHIFKEQPVRHFLNDLKDDDVIFLTGIRKLESRRRGSYSPIESGKRVAGQTLVQPIIDWKDIEVWLYIFWKRIEINELYEMGHARVGCWPCPCTPPLMDLMRRLTHPNLWAKFEKLLLEYAKENHRSEEWVKRSLWRLRRPKRRKFIIDPIGIEDDNEEILFSYKLPYRASFPERLKIIGDLEINNGSFSVKSNHIKINGKNKDGYIELKIRCQKSNYANSKRQIEKLFSRSLNCIGCGACTSSCPQGALKVTDNGAITVSEKCNKCEMCLKAPCVIEDSEKMFVVKMVPFIIRPHEERLKMNQVIFPNEELGKSIARKLRARQMNIELHEGGRVISIDDNFPRWRLERIVASEFFT